MDKLWVVYALVAAVGWGVNYALIQHVLTNTSIYTIAFIQYLFGALIFLVMHFVSNGTWVDVKNSLQGSPKSWFFVILTAAIANLLMLSAISEKNASHAAMIEMSYPIFVVIAAWFILKEIQITPALLTGGALIFAGVLVMYLWK